MILYWLHFVKGLYQVLAVSERTQLIRQLFDPDSFVFDLDNRKKGKYALAELLENANDYGQRRRGGRRQGGRKRGRGGRGRGGGGRGGRGGRSGRGRRRNFVYYYYD